MQFLRHHTTLILASTVTVAAFLAASVYTQHQLVKLDDLSTTIERNAAPSIEYLARAGVRLRRIRDRLHEGVEMDRHEPVPLADLDAELAAFEQDTARYLTLPPLPGEQRLWTDLHAQVHEAAAIARTAMQAEESGDIPKAALLLRTEADTAFDRADASLFAALEFHVTQSERLAREVRDLRASDRQTVVLLNAIAVVIAIVAAVVAVRAARQHDLLAESHNALLNERVVELDRFAGRVAHDILSPLDTIGFGLAMLTGPADAARQQTYIARAQRALGTVQRLVGDLLAFARSGARPEAQMTCRLDSVLAEVAAECAGRADEERVELAVHPVQGIEIACSAGVATSIVQNLVRNAIKYMGSSSIRRVTVRAEARGAIARLEVEDTGPGIPEDRQLTIFEPFIRGPHQDTDGIGLGLATVKRLVDAHGGRISVSSHLGTGTTFRVELPLAPGSDVPAADATHQA